MGVLGNLLGKKEEVKEEPSAAPAQGKYSEPCSLCGNPGTEKKWMGKYWHFKCIRKSKKVAKGMF